MEILREPVIGRDSLRIARTFSAVRGYFGDCNQAVRLHRAARTGKRGGVFAEMTMKKMAAMIFVSFCVACSGDSGGSKRGDSGTTVAADGGMDAARDRGDAAHATTDGGLHADVGDTTDVGRVADAGADASRDVDLGPVGGVRPADVVVPSDWSADGSYPVVVLLHGYSATSNIQDFYFRTRTLVDEMQFVLVLPDGLEDSAGNQYWNATDWCCDFNETGPDDSTYLSQLADEVVQRYAGDRQRVYFFGHSNGGFMSYRMACDHADQIAAIASLAGSGAVAPTTCQPGEPVAVLQIHGTFDATIRYGGDTDKYPGVDEMISRWRTHNGCDTDPMELGRVDYDSAVVGDETVVTRHPSCEGATSVELWRMDGSGHIPSIDADLARDALEFLFRHSKQP